MAKTTNIHPLASYGFDESNTFVSWFAEDRDFKEKVSEKITPASSEEHIVKDMPETAKEKASAEVGHEETTSAKA